MNRVEDARARDWRWRTLVSVALIVICGGAAYSNSFTDLFLGLDGKESIRDNPHLRRIWPLSEAISMPLWPNPADLDDIRKGIPKPTVGLPSLWQELTERSDRVVLRPHNPMNDTPTIALRPTFSLSLALTNHFIGAEPWAHHAVNIAIHIAAALALFGIVRLTLRRELHQPNAARASWWALAAALIWLVHPLQTESVTYIVQRAEALMGLLLLLAVYCAIRAVGSPHRFWWQLGAITACILGTGSKQTAVFTPLLVLLYDYTFFSRSKRKWFRPLFYFAMAAPLWIVMLTHTRALGAHFEPVKYLTYASAQPGVVLHYLKLAFWPDQLFLYVNTELFEVRSATQIIVPTVILVTVFAATIYAVIRRHWLGFVGGWFFITLGPTSSFFDATDLIQEHRMYVPLAALAVLAVITGDFAVRAVMPGRSTHARTVAKATLIAVVVLALGIRTYARNWDYHDEFGPIHPADLHGDYTILADHYLSKEGLIEVEAERAREMLRTSDPNSRNIPFAHFVIGLAHASKGESQQAASELRRVVAMEPDYAYAHYHLGEVLRGLGDLAGAKDHYQQAIHLEPTFVYAYKGLALALVEEGDKSRAEEYLRQALEIQPAFAEGHYELGLIALLQDDRRSAAEHFQSAVRYQPKFVEAHLELGTLRMDEGDSAAARRHFAAARGHLEIIVRSRPDFADAHRQLSVALFGEGLVDAAVQHAEEAVRLEPLDAKAHHDLAIVLRASGDHRRAADHFEEAIRVNPDFAAAYQGLGTLWHSEGHLQRAIAYLETAIRLQPDLAQAYHDLGTVLRDLGDPAGAKVRFRQAIARQPDLAEAHAELGMIALDWGNREEALRHFRQAASHRSDLFDAHYELGRILMHTGDIREARENLAIAVRLRPRFAEARRRLGMVLFEEGDVEGAYEHAAEAVRLKPGWAQARHDLGIVQSARGQITDAAESFEEAIRLQPDFAEAYYELGILWRDQNDLDRATDSLETAVRLNPDFAQAHFDLAQVLRDRGDSARAAEHFRRAADLDPALGGEA